MNLKHPVVFHIQELELDIQRDVIGAIENFFAEQNLSYKFPYPIYVISGHELSITNVPIVHTPDELPKFFTSRDSKMNVKESHLAGKNKLLQQEVKNSDSNANIKHLEDYGSSHKIIYELEQERVFYRTILNRLVKGKK